MRCGMEMRSSLLLGFGLSVRTGRRRPNELREPLGRHGSERWLLGEYGGSLGDDGVVLWF